MRSFTSLARDTGVINAPWGNARTERAITALGAMQTATSTLVLILFFINFGKITITRK